MTTSPLTLTSPKQRHGAYYEQLAKAFLLGQGLTLIAQNWQQPKVGELDLVMLHKGQAWDILVFIEVRKRTVSGYGDAFASITPSKQRKLIKTARYFMQRQPKYGNLECRFDVIAFDVLSNALPNVSPNVLPHELLNELPLTSSQKQKHQQQNNIAPSPEWIQGAFITSAW